MTRALVRLYAPGEDSPRITEDAVPLGDGRYRIVGVPLETGEWRIDVTIQRAGLPDTSASIPWVVPAGSSADRAVASIPPKDTAMLVALAAALLGGLALWGARRRFAPAALALAHARPRRKE